MKKSYLIVLLIILITLLSFAYSEEQQINPYVVVNGKEISDTNSYPTVDVFMDQACNIKVYLDGTDKNNKNSATTPSFPFIQIKDDKGNIVENIYKENQSCTFDWSTKRMVGMHPFAAGESEICISNKYSNNTRYTISVYPVSKYQASAR